MKLLYITGLSGKRINGFMRSAILAAKEMGIDFTIVSNMTMADKEGYKEDCRKYDIKALHIDLDRNPLGKNNKRAHGELYKIIMNGKYDVIHCNTPTGGVLGRLCAHEINKERIKNGKKPIYVIYQAHGFHFWKGAPKKNWLIFYPVEKFLAHWTDMLITINQEDYQVAKKFKLQNSGKVILHPGVGVNIKDFQNVAIDRDKKREELGVKTDQLLFLNVGELIDRKNQKVLLEAMKKLNNPNIVLMIAGDGEKKEELEKNIHDLQLEKSVKLLGYRPDVKELLKAADCFVFPSYQEGLPGALMEAMAGGLPCIASNIRGNTDALQDSGFMFSPDDVDGLAELMKVMLYKSSRIAEGKANEERVKRFDISRSIEAYKKVYTIAEEAIR
ncbi:MAG: glycosyltransferase family 4 protein [Lachnospiraceae bacterium]|nr:glycosyltransferase family 4 protein [Lachnospiraceae bacterium]